MTDSLYNSDSYELRPIDMDIINTEDPDQFIDLLNVSSYTAGDSAGNIPVERHRLIFEKWLEHHTAQKCKEARIDELSKIVNARGLHAATRPYVDKRMAELEGSGRDE